MADDKNTTNTTNQTSNDTPPTPPQPRMVRDSAYEITSQTVIVEKKK